MNDISPEAAKEAWLRLLNDEGRSGDGMLARLWLRQELMRCSPEGASTCAVHELEGRRKFARELISFAVGDSERPGTTDAADAGDAALERGRRRVTAAARTVRGAGRRVP